MLTPVQTVCWEAMISAAMMAARSKRIKPLVAARPGYINPVLMARMLATFDNLTGGRLAINLIAGQSEKEVRSEGIWTAKDDRYAMMDEEVTIMKALWTAKRPLDFEGRFYKLEASQVRPRMVQQPYPKFYLGGGSDAALAMSAKHSDVHLFWGDHLERIGEQMHKIRGLADEHGRADTIGFGMRLLIICREREADAWDAADRMIAGVSDSLKSMVANHFGTSVAYQRMQQIHRDGTEPLGDRDHMLMPNLWAGLIPIRPGAGVAIVGNPEQCAAVFQKYIDIGIHSFCLSGWLHDEEAERFGRLILPLLRRNNPGRAFA